MEPRWRPTRSPPSGPRADRHTAQVQPVDLFAPLGGRSSRRRRARRESASWLARASVAATCSGEGRRREPGCRFTVTSRIVSAEPCRCQQAAQRAPPALEVSPATSGAGRRQPDRTCACRRGECREPPRRTRRRRARPARRCEPPQETAACLLGRAHAARRPSGSSSMARRGAADGRRGPRCRHRRGETDEEKSEGGPVDHGVAETAAMSPMRPNGAPSSTSRSRSRKSAQPEVVGEMQAEPEAAPAGDRDRAPRDGRSGRRAARRG